MRPKQSSCPEIAGIILLFMMLVSGCTTHTGYAIGERGSDRVTSAGDIEVVERPVHSDYRVVGRVHAHSRAVKWLPWLLASEDVLVQKLKKEAALLGADVIFDIQRYSRSQFEWQEEHLAGTAAAIRNKGAGDAQ